MVAKKMLLGGTLALALAGFLGFVQPQPASALFEDSKKNACEGIQGTTTPTGDCATGGTSVNSIITTVINILSLVVGIVAVIMIMVGGFRYITANGDSGNIQSAKNTVMYALIGLVVVAFAQFLVQFVLDKAIQDPKPPEPQTTMNQSVNVVELTPRRVL